MKIEQDLQTGEVFYKLNSDEECNGDNILSALVEFVKLQAIEVFRHTKEYRKLVGRLDELERQLNNLKNQLNNKEKK
jgi:polyhydroxyalkanoate synthesis regulator phasin